MHAPPPRPVDYGSATPAAHVEPVQPDSLRGDLRKALREAGQIIAIEPELADIRDALDENDKRRYEVRAATEELNAEKNRPVLARPAERHQ